MADGRATNGGRRQNSGRKKKQLSEELQMLFDVACPKDAREKIVRTMTARAQSGDVKAAAFVFDRIYGTPMSGDELKIAEIVEAELEAFRASMEKNLDPETWKKVQQALSGT